jgi:hypothetical protein
MSEDNISIIAIVSLIAVCVTTLIICLTICALDAHEKEFDCKKFLAEKNLPVQCSSN